jgi:hypothetical protein
MVVCRVLGDPEVGSDLAVGEAPGDEDHYLLLATGKLAQRFAGRRSPAGSCN